MNQMIADAKNQSHGAQLAVQIENERKIIELKAQFEA